LQQKEIGVRPIQRYVNNVTLRPNA